MSRLVLKLVGPLALLVGGTWASAQTPDRFRPYPRPTPREQKIEEALDSPAKIDCDALPLGDLVKRLADTYKVPIIIDRRGLDDAGLSADADLPLTYQSGDESLREALRWLLGDFDLVAVPFRETLLITTVEESESQLVTKIYPVADLLEDEVGPGWQSWHGGRDGDSLIDAVIFAVSRVTWDEVGGPGSITYLHKCLVVSQTVENHRHIDQFLTELRKLLHPFTEKPKNEQPVIVSDSPPGQKVTQALQALTEVKFDQVPMSDALQVLEQRHHVRMMIDRRALDDAGIAPEDAKVSLSVKDITLASALTILLRDYDITYIPRKYWIEITTAEEAENQVETGLYDVADLVFTDVDPTSEPDYDGLTETLTTLIAPTTWDEGGHHLASFGNCLIIPQTAAIHAQITEFLASLRAANKAQTPPADPAGTQLVTYPQLSSMTGMVLLSPDQVANVASAVQRWVEPKGWKSAGGAYLIDVVNSTLLIEAPANVQQEVRKFLAKLGVTRGDSYGVGGMGGGFGGGLGNGGILILNGGTWNAGPDKQGSGAGSTGKGANFFAPQQSPPTP